MYNTVEEKPYPVTQTQSMQPEQFSISSDNFSCEKLVQDLSGKISQLMLPLYDNFANEIEGGKVMGFYPVLRFPGPNQMGISRKQNSYSNNEYQNNHKVNYRQIVNRLQEKEKQQHFGTLSESKIHQLLDQNEARQYEESIPEDRCYSAHQYSEMKKLQKARKYYEKLSKDLKSTKRMRRRFKDKNRPKKAKSAYNLFVEDVVPQIKSENPTFSAPDLVRVAAKMYNQLTEQQKLPYQKRYLIDKERFEREREVYFKKHPEMDYRLDAKQKSMFMQGKFRQL